jgi:hypothetical protein
VSRGVRCQRIWLAGIAGPRVVARFMDVEVEEVLAFGPSSDWCSRLVHGHVWAGVRVRMRVCV